MEIKYTKDGKKVAIVNIVNANQYIVQEIYLVEDNEIPQGEQFVINSSDLKNDYVATSWHARQLQREKETYEEKLEHYSRQLKGLNANYRKICTVMKQKTKYLKSLSEKINNSMFDRLIDFLTGKIKYVVVNHYGRYEICGFNSTIIGAVPFDDTLKLISLFGDDDGSLTFRINNYSDGSGNQKTIMPFKTYDTALVYVKNEINALNEYNDNIIETAKKYSVVLKPELVKKYWQQKIDVKQKQIDSIVAEIEKKKDELERMRKQLFE